MSVQLHCKLHHKTPPWVEDGAVFHIRIRADVLNKAPLTQEPLAKRLLDSVRFYEKQARWYPHLFLLMPDHVHALLAFDRRSDSITHIIGDWKGFHARKNGVRWQENFFDHRIRNREELDEKASYIRMNPVRKGLCANVGDWPFVMDRITGTG